ERIDGGERLVIGREDKARKRVTPLIAESANLFAAGRIGQNDRVALINPGEQLAVRRKRGHARCHAIRRRANASQFLACCSIPEHQRRLPSWSTARKARHHRGRKDFPVRRELSSTAQEKSIAVDLGPQPSQLRARERVKKSNPIGFKGREKFAI